MNNENLDWTISHKPQLFSEILVTPEIKQQLMALRNSESGSLILISGPTGIGKSLIGQLLAPEVTHYLSCLQYKDLNFAKQLERTCSCISLSGKRRVVVLDDADYIDPKDQDFLRVIFDNFRLNNDFILIANEPFRLKERVRSRLQEITLDYFGDADFHKTIHQFLISIADKEGFPDIGQEDIAQIVLTYFPDIRKMIKVLQANLIGVS